MVKGVHTNSQALNKASIITGLSLLIGAGYYLYLATVSAPHALARITPFVWLVTSIIGLGLGVQALRARAIRPIAVIIVAAALLSAVLAAIFSMAALIGD